MSTKDGFSGSSVPDQLLSNVLWAAYGHTPNGRTIQQIDDSTIIYVCRQDGGYKYIPETHSLQLVKEGDYSWVGQKDAPIQICLIHDTNKATEVRGMAEIGKIGQNIYLEAIALGLGTITTAGQADEAETALELPANEDSKIIMPLGYPSSSYSFSPAPPPTSNLPPVVDTGISLELVLSTLNIATQWNDEDLTTQALSNVVWAAYGISYLYDAKENLHRTVPSAYSYYPFIIYVVNETAAYEYDPSTHSISMQADGDKRQSIADASEQFVADAPVILVAGSTRYNGVYRPYWDYEVGSIGHNVLLESTGLGLGANMVEVSDPDAVETALNLGYNLYHMFVMPVGHTEGPIPPVRQYTFDTSLEGWSFISLSAPGFSGASSGHSGGRISIGSANDTTNRVGLWNGPGAIPYVADNVYRASYVVSSSQTTTAANPQFRMRWTQDQSLESATHVVNAAGSYSYALPTDPTTATYTCYFAPILNYNLGIAFDMLDFDAGQYGTHYVDMVTVERFARPSTSTLVKAYTDGSDFANWVFVSTGVPFGTVTSGGSGTGTLTISSTLANSNNYGWWQSSPTADELTYVADKLYRATYTLRCQTDAARNTMPQVRLRCQNEDGQMTQTMELSSQGAGGPGAMPEVSGTDYEVYWETPILPGSPGTGEDEFIVAIDVLDFDGTKGGTIYMDSVAIEYLEIP